MLKKKERVAHIEKALDDKPVSKKSNRNSAMPKRTGRRTWGGMNNRKRNLPAATVIPIQIKMPLLCG
jgi:hypothetical protein